MVPGARALRRPAALVRLVVGASLLCGVTAASAASSDKAAAEAALEDVEKAGLEGKAGVGAAAAAKQALTRATSARSGGDVLMGELLEGLARTHAEMARDAVRASKIEAERTAAELRTTELTTDTERKKALLEEIAARKQRAEADFVEATAAAAARPPKPEGKTDTKGEGKKVSATGEVRTDKTSKRAGKK